MQVGGNHYERPSIGSNGFDLASIGGEDDVIHSAEHTRNDADFVRSLESYARKAKNPLKSMQNLLITMVGRIENLTSKNDRPDSIYNHQEGTREKIAQHEQQGQYPEPLIPDAESMARYRRRVEIAHTLYQVMYEEGVHNPASLDDTARGNEDERTKTLEVVQNHPALQKALQAIGILKIKGKSYGIAIARENGRVMLPGSQIRAVLTQLQSEHTDDDKKITLADVFENATIEFPTGTVHLAGSHAENATDNSVAAQQYIKVPSMNNTGTVDQNAIHIASKQPSTGDSVFVLNPNTIGAIKTRASDVYSMLSADYKQGIGKLSADAKTILGNTEFIVTNEQGELVSIIQREALASSNTLGAGSTERIAQDWRSIKGYENQVLGDNLGTV